MKTFTLTIFFLLYSPILRAKDSAALMFKVHYKSGQKTKILKAGTTPVYLELGEKVKGIVIKGEGEYRLFQLTESSVTVMNEGPHLDLTEWKHGVSPLVRLKESDGIFLYKEQFKETDFPKVSNKELVHAVKKLGGERWAETAKNCKTPGTYPCEIAPSRYHFKVEKFIDGEWKAVGEINLYPPMGC